MASLADEIGVARLCWGLHPPETRRGSMIESQSCFPRVVFKLGINNRLWPLFSWPSVHSSWVTYYGKLELLAAMGSWSCWQLGNDDLLQCVMFVLNHIVWVGYWLAPQKSLFGPSLSYPFLYLNSFSSYLRGRSPACLKRKKNWTLRQLLT